jgi:hypothetical protein
MSLNVRLLIQLAIGHLKSKCIRQYIFFIYYSERKSVISLAPWCTLLIRLPAECNNYRMNISLCKTFRSVTPSFIDLIYFGAAYQELPLFDVWLTGYNAGLLAILIGNKLDQTIRHFVMKLLRLYILVEPHWCWRNLLLQFYHQAW